MIRERDILWQYPVTVFFNFGLLEPRREHFCVQAHSAIEASAEVRRRVAKRQHESKNTIRWQIDPTTGPLEPRLFPELYEQKA